MLFRSALHRELEQLKKEQAKQLKANLKAEFTEINGIQCLIKQVDAEVATLKDLAFELGNEVKEGTICKASPICSVILSANGDKLRFWTIKSSSSSSISTVSMCAPSGRPSARQRVAYPEKVPISRTLRGATIRVNIFSNRP